MLTKWCSCCNTGFLDIIYPQFKSKTKSAVELLIGWSEEKVGTLKLHSLYSSKLSYWLKKEEKK